MGKAARTKRTMRRYLTGKAEKYQAKLQNGGVLAEAAVASQQTKPTQWEWQGVPEDKLALLDRFDTHAGLRGGLARVARRDSEWAGIPMPLDGERLVIEPTYPCGQELAKIGNNPDRPSDGIVRKIRNQFWSWHRRSTIIIWEEAGKITWGLEGEYNHLNNDLKTLGCADAWSLESEQKALQTLGEFIRHRQMRQYLLTGSFLETSKRSRVTYLFRKLRPTIAMSSATGEIKILCALCLHPIAYYADSWAGAMTPTDDVLAHLMLMRGDEKLLWRRANQHPSWRSAAGI